MTQEQHPITPPPWLVEQWMRVNDFDIAPLHLAQTLTTQAARWGADQELEACVNWLLLNGWGQAIDQLRATRRPKPPSLKEQALKILDLGHGLADCDRNTLRRALEALPDD